MLRLSTTVVVLCLLSLGLEAFVPSLTPRSPPTSLHLFGKKKPVDVVAPSKSTKPEKEPFIFLFGKPEYDWVKNKPVAGGRRSHNWLNKPSAPPNKKK